MIAAKGAEELSDSDVVELAGKFGVAEIAGRYFLYDAGLSYPTSTPTTEIPKIAYESLRPIVSAFSRKARMSVKALSEAAQLSRETIAQFRKNQFIKVASPAAAAPDGKAASTAAEKLGRFFAEFGSRVHPQDTFFRVPAELPLQGADVAMIGLPWACKQTGRWTEIGYWALLTESVGSGLNWLQIHEEGAYSEFICDDGRGSLLGKGVVLKDTGPIRVAGETLQKAYEMVKVRLGEVLASGAKPLIVGGDHAITFPVLLAWNELAPEQLSRTYVIHMDAHHDYFLFDRLQHDHAAPFYDVAETTNVAGILSFGVRTFLDARVKPHVKQQGAHLESKRLKHYGMLETRRFIGDPESFKRLLPPNARVYLSVDVDVLDKSVIAGSTQAPISGGLSWHELIAFVDMLSRHFSLIGADVVEYAPVGETAQQNAFIMQSFLIFLIDRLARKQPPPRRRRAR